MDLKITPQVVAGFSDKDSKKEHFRSLYEQHEFIDAYAKHTDLRMQDNPKGAIGREDEWETHGLLQLEFLKSEGLRPEHRLLDMGCGPGRAARRFVPYLQNQHYFGVDVSGECLRYARELAHQEGWDEKQPVFQFDREGELNLFSSLLGTFDFIWAHSVFTHLPPDKITKIIAHASRLLDFGGKFLFTYKSALSAQRSGLKQFQYPASFFIGLADKKDMDGEELPYLFPAHQRTIRLTKRMP